MANDVIDNFIDDTEQPREDISFYRKLVPDNLDHYYKFPNQTSGPRVAAYEEDEMYFGTEDQQPDFYAPENGDNVEFDKFAGFEKSVKKFMEMLKL